MARTRINVEEMQREQDLRYSGQWFRARWWRVIDPDGSLWCETSDEDEARESMRPGDTLQSMWMREERQWRDEDMQALDEPDEG